MLPKIWACVKSYDGETKQTFEDDVLIKKYNTIWNKVSADIKKEFDSEPVYNFFFKIKVKSHTDEVTDFYDK